MHAISVKVRARELAPLDILGGIRGFISRWLPASSFVRSRIAPRSYLSVRLLAYLAAFLSLSLSHLRSKCRALREEEEQRR